MKNRTYRYFNGEVLYPFGYGLSYTTFSYADSRISSARVSAHDSVIVSVNVTNTGTMDGDEVVQLYAMHPDVPGAPARALVGFQRVHLARGASQRVQFTLRDRDLSVVDPEGVRRIVPGAVQLWVGGGQPNAQHQGSAQAPGVAAQFQITSAATLPN
jgi:beta-glucosidase